MGAQIAVVQGAASVVVQRLFGEFVAQLPATVRVAGVIEDLTDAAGDGCMVGVLRSLGDGHLFSIAQDLGPGSTACKVDAGGIVAACGAVCRDIEAGCDLVVLSKWGKVEADRSGLADAFAAAISAGVPVLTSVAPKFTGAWDTFAAPMYVLTPPNLASISAWWDAWQAGAAPSSARAQAV